MIAGDIVWVGTPENVIERIRETIEVCEGLTEIAITTNPGGVEHWKAIKAQELFAEHVVPVIQRDAEGARGGRAIGKRRKSCEHRHERAKIEPVVSV
jgi:hypothetical protein